MVVIYSAVFIRQRCFSIVYEKCSRRCRVLHFHRMSPRTLFRRQVNVETLSRTCRDYKRGSKGFSYSYHLKTFSHIMRFSLPRCSLLRAVFCNARQPHWDALSSAWSRCLHVGPQGHLSRRKFHMPSTQNSSPTEL